MEVEPGLQTTKTFGGELELAIMYLLLLILGASWTSEPLSYSVLVILITSLTSNYDDVQMTSQKVNCTLGGGFKYFLFSPLPGEDSHVDEHIFQRGWFNHQPVHHLLHYLKDIPGWGNISIRRTLAGTVLSGRLKGPHKSTIKNGHCGIELNPFKRDNRKYLLSL